jgi:hypothetical protein
MINDIEVLQLFNAGHLYDNCTGMFPKTNVFHTLITGNIHLVWTTFSRISNFAQTVNYHEINLRRPVPESLLPPESCFQIRIQLLSMSNCK